MEVRGLGLWGFRALGFLGGLGVGVQALRG